MNDILKQINLRLSSPFVFSFCVSWVFINWPIVVGLFWHNPETIETFGYTSYADLVNKNITLKYNLIFPMVSATTYTLIIPVLGYLNSVYLALIKKMRNRTVHRILQNLPISYRRYNKLVTEARQTEQQLASDIEEEEKKHADANAKIAEQEKAIMVFKNDVDFQKQTSDPIALNGRWAYTLPISSRNGGSRVKEWRLEITNNEIRNPASSVNLATINGYLYSPANNLIAILFYDLDEDGPFARFGDRYILFDVEFKDGLIFTLKEKNGIAQFKRNDDKK